MMFALRSLIGLLALQEAQAATQNIVEVVQGIPVLSTLVGALTKADLVTVLSGAGPFTVFAPTNAAFDKYLQRAAITTTTRYNASVKPEILPLSISDLLKPEKKQELVALLKHHVVASKVMAASLKNNISITTLQNQVVTGYVSGGNTKINSARVITADVEATNGVVHTIDTVLEPREFFYGVATTTTLKGHKSNMNMTTTKLKSNKSGNMTQTTRQSLSSTASTTGIVTAVVVALGFSGIQ